MSGEGKHVFATGDQVVLHTGEDRHGPAYLREIAEKHQLAGGLKNGLQMVVERVLRVTMACRCGAATTRDELATVEHQPGCPRNYDPRQVTRVVVVPVGDDLDDALRDKVLTISPSLLRRDR